MAALRTATLSTYHTSTKWVPDHSYDSCFGCLRKFNMFNRRHHCRLCGQLFCKSCSSSRIELASDQGFVRVCDSCYQKHRGGVNPLSPITFPGPFTKAVAPIPRSIFSCHNEPIGHVNMVASFDDNLPIAASSRLSKTLSCNCYSAMPSSQIHAFQSGHWTFNDSRLRMDLQFQSQGSVLFSARLHSPSATYVGAGHARIQTAEMTVDDGDKPDAPRIAIGLIEELIVDLRDIKTNEMIRLAGSLAWRRAQLDPGARNMAEENENHTEQRWKGSTASRISLLAVVEAEIFQALAGIDEGQDNSRQKTDNELGRRILSSNEVVLGSTTTDKNDPYRGSTIHDPLGSFLNIPMQYKVKASQLQMMKECIVRANECVQDGKSPDDAQFSCMCFHCFGTIIV
uniref:FYVE-type domain-containing protein n=1 Tax=Spongospora subterranea TaxID=70186 RepID=A0A0H5RDL8_9EUKA|eukprot:CRZ11846.1 hypothetical protein [Spongospora subterranea]